VAFVTSHPIQYQVPVFRELTLRKELDLTVVFAQIPDAASQGSGFGVSFAWDIPLLDGYRYHLLKNIAKQPSVVTYAGCDTPDIFDYLRRETFDAVIVNGWVVKTCLQTLRACERLGIPCVVRGEANHLRPRPWWKRVLQRWLVRRYSAYLYIGEANREFYKSYGVTDDRLFPCRYCIENNRFAEAANSEKIRRQGQQRWGVDPERTCFLYSGKFEEKKHPVELVRAFGAAIRQGLQGQLLMVGDGELRKECEQLATREGWPVLFTGFVNQSQIPEVYAASDCLVLASDAGETWGLVVNEAMAAGRPAIVSSLVGCRADLIKEGVTGWSFPFGKWGELTARLLTAAANPDHLALMGKAAQQTIEKYSPAEAAIGMETAVRWISEQQAKN
jgi:glycosyltransferase involved in cell wall biosynthesis